MTLLFIYLFIALFTSFLCSILESALLSVPISYLIAKSEKGDKSANTLIEMKQNVDKPLSSILSLNTVAHTIGAAGVGAQATIVFGEAYFGLVSAILTILILVFTEIIPKTLGANYSKELGPFTASTLKVLIIITYPLVVLSAVITRLLLKKEPELTTSREEISALANIGTQEGVFGDKENKIIQNLIKLKSIRVSEIMTPRVVMVSANEIMKLEEFNKNREFIQFSRIPVYKNNRDNITGYIFRQQVFEKLAEDQFELQLKELKREIVILGHSTTLFKAWEKLLTEKEHIALVVDEYGGVDGIVTHEDIIETLIGFEIVDEKDEIVDMQQYALEKWKKRRKGHMY
ncbi:HlyC/CorC family transporter [Marivirga sp. S37H4]|uniref:HlyC/CorC family transporter n=1 Tax=Marivirga aurantiaca TaxID=2802615 RepID=A0A934WZN4_9BACT|nr:hemolysin family protein [Marivirga aurantiaca]MBK6266168.1 HlyC/CorC family transporter [Marivirga aurantiaca]